MSGAWLADSRTLAPPARRVVRVIVTRTLGAYRLLTALDAEGPSRPRPGQFYMLSTAGGWGGGTDQRPYLPRAFSYAGARPGPDGLELDFLLEDVGPGTRRLDQIAVGDGLALVGPLGNGFGPSAGGTRALLVGGGIGAAPLACLARERGRPTEVILGFRSAVHAEAAALFDAARVVTEDGAVGERALVTAPLALALDRDPATTVFSCGPPAMLEAVRAMCAERAIPAQLAMESGMACGYGACFGCTVPTKNGYVRLCVDGPVLEGDSLETCLVGEVPL